MDISMSKHPRHAFVYSIYADMHNLQQGDQER